MIVSVHVTDLQRKAQDRSEVQAEISAERFVYITPAEGLEDGVYCPWSELAPEQQTKFLSLSEELTNAYERLLTLFKDVPTGPEPGHFWN